MIDRIAHGVAAASVLLTALSSPQIRAATHVAICISNLDGSDFQILAKEPEPGMTQNGSPSWSPDGKSIAFDSTTSNRDYSASHIYLIDVAGPDKGQFTDIGNGVVPTWSPDSKELAFMLNPGNPSGLPYGFWIAARDGTETRWAGEGSGTPVWSPKGDLIATADFGGRRRIYLLDFEKTGRRLLFPDGEGRANSRLTWSPDGQSLAFVPIAPLGDELFWVVNVMQNDPQPVPLATVPKAEGYPAQWGMPVWSPDGKWMVFQMFPNEHRGPDLYVISVDDPGPPKKIDHPEVLTSGSPSWSPDSQRIVFAADLPEE